MHNIHYADYKENVNRSHVQTEWDNYAAHEDWQEGCSGLPNSIRWIERDICDGYDEAQEYIESHDNGWYDQLAVRYRVYPKVKGTKKYTELIRRRDEAEKALRELDGKIHYQNVSSEFVGCKNCGSRIARAYIKTNNCPVCRKDLRPATTLDRIKNMKEKISKMNTEIKGEEKKMNAKSKGKAELRWLVKVEYHT